MVSNYNVAIGIETDSGTLLKKPTRSTPSTPDLVMESTYMKLVERIAEANGTLDLAQAHQVDQDEEQKMKASVDTEPSFLLGRHCLAKLRPREVIHCGEVQCGPIRSKR
ncbi:hypothetical protein RRG08_001255 [Elysia crispata]|uniref:Uncharacterized protein n=1 Tax=Elysia crispata TaxID=231223 RepID=A0AAE1B872_9GAST|nr:hypothetical protein RRG08_001255 [Elysia crispata]